MINVIGHNCMNRLIDKCGWQAALLPILTAVNMLFTEIISCEKRRRKHRRKVLHAEAQRLAKKKNTPECWRRALARLPLGRSCRTFVMAITLAARETTKWQMNPQHNWAATQQEWRKRGKEEEKKIIIANQPNENALTAKPVATAATFAETLAVYSAFAFQGKHDWISTWHRSAIQRTLVICDRSHFHWVLRRSVACPFFRVVLLFVAPCHRNRTHTNVSN